ncbi:MAG TPA: hypothetical protein PK843_13770 [bacterium]|nr:hypothetical protein [bacterium]HPN35578.1 hypothetical protein [bacterium]
MTKRRLLIYALSCAAWVLACAPALHRYHMPSTVPQLVLIEDQVYDLQEMPDETSGLIELHLRNGKKVSGRFISCDRERISLSPGFTYAAPAGARAQMNVNTTSPDAGKVMTIDRRQSVDKDDVLLVKMW